MEKGFDYYGNEGYAVVSGTIKKIDADRILMNEKGEFIYALKDGECLVNPVLYASIKDFENGEPKPKQKIWLSGACSYEEKDGCVNTIAWRMVDGEPQKFSMPLMFNVGYRLEPIFPESYYPSRDACIRNEVYQYENEDGVVVGKVGIERKLRLNDEQMKFIEEELAPMFKKANQLGIKLLFSGYCDKLKAMNIKDVGKLGCDFCQESATKVSSENFFVVDNANIWYNGEDDVYYDETEN